MRSRILFIIGIIVAVAALVVFYYGKDHKASLPKQGGTESAKQNLTQVTADKQNASELTLPVTNQPAEAQSGKVPPSPPKGYKVYRNNTFDFALSYPESLGEAEVTELTPATPGICMKAGKELFGQFSKNKSLDFALATPDFEPCVTTLNPLFAVKSVTVKGNTLQLGFGAFRPDAEVPLEVTMITGTSGINAYVFKNTIDKHSSGELAAVVSSPHPTLGHPVFRTHGIGYEEGLKLLRQVIAP